MTDHVDPVRFALVPTHNRPRELAALARALDGQCSVIVVVDNASDPPVNPLEVLTESGFTGVITLIRDEEQPPNLSRMWNVGLDQITQTARRQGLAHWDVAVFNDDVDLPAGWYDYVASGLRTHDVVITSADAYGYVKTPLVKRRRDNDLMTRMCPWAFVTRGEAGLRADETLRWWWGDTDLDWHARENGGVLVLPGYIARNSLANSTTHGELAEQAGRDRRRFAEKWGGNPW